MRLEPRVLEGGQPAHHLPLHCAGPLVPCPYFSADSMYHTLRNYFTSRRGDAGGQKEILLALM